MKNCFIMSIISVVGLEFFAASPAKGLEIVRATTDAPHGLTVREDGALLLAGRPYRGIGVNYHNAFFRRLEDPKDTSYDEGFARLAAAGIPFARFAACGFWPSGQKLYQEDPQEFFRRFDDVVRSAEKHGIGLIPSFFFYAPTVPDLVGEPVGRWGDPQSKTQEYMRNYVRDVVTRYRNSPAIWGWEFGNEYSLAASLPNASDGQAFLVNPREGTPAGRSAADNLTYEAIRAAFVAFAQEVRKYDAHRVIFTGNSIPRPAAWHNWKENNYTVDAPEQHAEMLRDDNPDPIDTITVHIYGAPLDDYQDVTTAINDCVRIARELKKPLFIGEFGAADSPERFKAMLGDIENAQVPLAALWVYDFSPQDKNYNITWTNRRAYQLQAVAEANARIRSATLENEKKEP